ncbi:YndJ family protein [Lederbergia sp. NSJ-179]|uniref:YndJ family protein n=1 Tax=Lederbergia sp. NSJ-179 TaxID=2931402 RepID=UPI001FD40FF5|nr:YndJ family protein [Lederbergia sp. NSJ-179]MCJ7840267.1 YndJ family protein [Lederbergia sp. NSJ-179]
MNLHKFIFIHIILFIFIAGFSLQPWPSTMLTIAQILYIPIMLQLVTNGEDWLSKNYYYFAIPAYGAVAFLQWTGQTPWDGWVAAIYFLFTVIMAIYGLNRFLRRGFVHLEEFSVDLGLIYLAIGGAWFFAYEAGLDTGFSALLTWLTAIHFHYSAFLLPIFIGFLGRLSKPAAYHWMTSLLLVSPMIVAIGITFSRWIELLSVLLYIIGIAGLIALAFKSSFQNDWQKWLVRISFLSLAVSISFSLLYAYGNLSFTFIVNMDFMLRFHGVLNCLVFGLLGVAGWSLCVPKSEAQTVSFPISKIRGKWVVGEKILEKVKKGENEPIYHGLVDDMSVYEINCHTLSPAIIAFYERTNDYRLSSTIRWSTWFKPFAALYRLWSRYVQQINLPISSKEVEMRGGIWAIQEEVDGRTAPRAWVRKVENEVVFVALYSEHKTKQKTYMNIALPLPWSAMVGILDVKQVGTGLQLTSKRKHLLSDSGIYLAWKKHLFKLPLEECFQVEEVAKGKLRAKHTMWIFGLPFLTIDYDIKHKKAG